MAASLSPLKFITTMTSDIENNENIINRCNKALQGQRPMDHNYGSTNQKYEVKQNKPGLNIQHTLTMVSLTSAVDKVSSPPFPDSPLERLRHIE